MELKLEPGRAAGPIEIGMTRGEVRAVMKRYKPVEEISVIFKVPIDFFNSNSVKVMYSKDEICEAVEISLPAKPTLQDKPIIGRTFTKTLEWFKQIDSSARVVDDGISARESGLGVFIPNAKRLRKGRVQSAIIFVSGYYEKYSLDNL